MRWQVTTLRYNETERAGKEAIVLSSIWVEGLKKTTRYVGLNDRNRIQQALYTRLQSNGKSSAFEISKSSYYLRSKEVWFVIYSHASLNDGDTFWETRR